MAEQAQISGARLSEAVFKGINAHDVTGISRYFADDVTAWDPTMQTPLKGRKAVEEYFRGQFRTFPDANVKVLQHIENVSGDSVATEIEWSGTQKGPIENPGLPPIPPTNKRVNGRAVMVGRSKDGKVTSFSIYYDLSTMMSQLGLAPGPGSR